jgi:hypothetical protein
LTLLWIVVLVLKVDRFLMWAEVEMSEFVVQTLVYVVYVVGILETGEVADTKEIAGEV